MDDNLTLLTNHVLLHNLTVYNPPQDKTLSFLTGVGEDMLDVMTSCPTWDNRESDFMNKPLFLSKNGILDFALLK